MVKQKRRSIYAMRRWRLHHHSSPSTGKNTVRTDRNKNKIEENERSGWSGGGGGGKFPSPLEFQFCFSFVQKLSIDQLGRWRLHRRDPHQLQWTSSGLMTGEEQVRRRPKRRRRRKTRGKNSVIKLGKRSSIRPDSQPGSTRRSKIDSLEVKDGWGGCLSFTQFCTRIRKWMSRKEKLGNTSP